MGLRKIKQMAKKVDFHKLGDELWSIANIFRDDTLKTTEYLEEFSYFLFLKLFDDKERMKEETNKVDELPFVSTLPEELRFYNWANKIIKGEISISEAVPYVRDVFQKYANLKFYDKRDLNKELSALPKYLAEIRLKEILDNRELFKRIFDKHIWRIKYGPTIRDLLKRLLDLELEQNFDVMGRAYEFVVQKLGEQKQYGQYFTPRHIIHFMVELADPEIGEKIYDPAAGTGGFILRAFEVVSKKINDKYSSDYSLAEKYFRELKGNCLWAVEKAPDVYKLALMNMILHNDGKSNLYEADSLDNRAQLEHKQKYDIVLSNPPYGPLTQSRVGTFDYHVKRFEALFIQHIMNALKFSEPNKKPSRAVVIILDKILFDSTRAFKGIRQKLLREYNLKGVFSMPAGIFQPYSGVKTTVLYFEKPTKEEWNKIKANNDYTTKQVLFFDVKSDGFTLSTQRRPLNGAFQGDEPNIYNPPCGDLPKAVKVFKEWLKALDSGKIEEFKEKYVDNEQVWLADIEEIKEKDFNLNPGLYKKFEKGKIKWEWVKLTDVADYKNESVEPFEGERNYLTTGGLEEETIIQAEKITYENKPTRANLEVDTNDVIFAKMKDTRKYLLINDKTKNLIVSTGFVVLKPKEDRILPKFLFYIVKSDNFQAQKDRFASGATQKAIGVKDLSNIEIPLPPIEIQKKIVERLDKQQAIIEKAKEMEKAILDAGIDDAIFEGDWEWVELGDVVEIKGGKRIPKGKTFSEVETPYKYIRLVDIEMGKIKVGQVKSISEELYNFLRRYLVSKDDVVLSIAGTTGLVAQIPPELDKAILTENAVKFIIKSDFIIAEFLKYCLMSNYLQNQIRKLTIQSSISKLPIYNIRTLKIPLPPLEKQKEIVEFLDTQFQALEKIRKMRENAEKKIKIILEKEVFENE